MTATAVTEAQIRALIEAVDRADQAGNRREADRALAQARAAAPDHPGVLNVAGMRALLAGDAGGARPLLERAAALDSGSSMLWPLNLALVHRELHDDPAERGRIAIQARRLKPGLTTPEKETASRSSPSMMLVPGRQFRTSRSG